MGGDYNRHIPWHPPYWEPIETAFTISDAIGDVICHFLKLQHQLDSESSVSPYMSNTAFWHHVSLGPWEPGPHDWGWGEKLHQKACITLSPLVVLADRCGLRDCKIFQSRVLQSINYPLVHGGCLWCNQALFFLWLSSWLQQRTARRLAIRE